MWINQQIYGNYRNRTFNDIFPSVEEFKDAYEEFNDGIIDNGFTNDKSLPTVWTLLSARYGNSTVASENETQFKWKVFAIIFQYGPTWERQLEVQKDIRALKIEDLQQGGKAIYNTALNPAQPVAGSKGASSGEGTQTTEELTYINQQNTTNYKKSKIDAYALLADIMKTDVTGSFLNKFKSLFLTVVSPELPLWYVTNTAEVDDNE